MAMFGVFPRPPLQQRGKTLFPLINRPVQLRRKIIEPAAGEPQARIGIQVCVRVEPLNLFGEARTPDAKRADAEFYPGFQRLDGTIEVFGGNICLFRPPPPPPPPSP